jgi:hypothetical protein
VLESRHSRPARSLHSSQPERTEFAVGSAHRIGFQHWFPASPVAGHCGDDGTQRPPSRATDMIVPARLRRWRWLAAGRHRDAAAGLAGRRPLLLGEGTLSITGTSRPSVLAILRLMTNISDTNLLNRSTAVVIADDARRLQPRASLRPSLKEKTVPESLSTSATEHIKSIRRVLVPSLRFTRSRPIPRLLSQVRERSRFIIFRRGTFSWSESSGPCRKSDSTELDHEASRSSYTRCRVGCWRISTVYCHRFGRNCLQGQRLLACAESV